MKILWFIALFSLVITGAVLLAGQFGLLRGKAPADLGVVDGKLKRPSLTPNSVSSQAKLYPDHPQKDYASIAPLSYSGDGEKAMHRLVKVLNEMERTNIITQEPGYVYAQCSTALLRFTDDVEFWLDKQAGVIQVRSSSRLGRKDFNVNRDRVEALRARMAQSE